jgi:hypothetical protein
MIPRSDPFGGFGVESLVAQNVLRRQQQQDELKELGDLIDLFSFRGS